MHAKDLDHKELLELDPEGGLIRFAGQRAQYLVENFGLTAARAVLTQFGFAHGWRMAEAMQAEFHWDSEEDWRRAGPRIHTLGGLFRVEPGGEDPLSKAGTTLLASYEAEQHLLHFGRSDSAVCWTISGLTSGYVSRTAGKDIYVLEDRCMGRGDAACHLLGRTPEQWGDERAEELRFFLAKRLEECLDVSLRRVTETLKKAEKKLRAHRRTLVRVAPDVEEPLGIVAKSPQMSQVVDLARRVAKVDATVLITGESGSGFGHARGAFTGATQDRPGLFETANRGTLLLDEVGEVSTAMQVKLLRSLQEGEIRRVGENKSRAVDVRILAATNRDLAEGVSGGAFRQDLYYRLKVVELNVPPLRERRDDILPLARVMLTSAAIRMKRKISGISPPAADQLLRYAWPGNVRELENAMERAVALARGGRVDLDDLPEEIRRAVPAPAVMAGAVRPLDEVEKEYILAALESNGGNQTHTARQLGIGLATLYRRLKSYGLIGDRKEAVPTNPRPGS
jgi:transcriptional regulator with AAA-type ATPase domain